MDWKSLAFLMAVLAAWFSFNRWILPRFGIATCMSGACSISQPSQATDPRAANLDDAGSVSDSIEQKQTLTELFDGNFRSEVLESSQPVLVDFWAPWCGPCKMVGPVVEELAMENAGLIKVGKINVDDSPATAAKYAIDSIPTLMIFKNGRVVDRFVGVQSKQHLQNAINQSRD